MDIEFDLFHRSLCHLTRNRRHEHILRTMNVWNLMVFGLISEWYLIRIYCNVYFLVNQKCILLTVTLFIDYCLIWMCLKRAILFYLISVSSIVSFSSRLHFSCQEIYRVIWITREIVQFLKNKKFSGSFCVKLTKLILNQQPFWARNKLRMNSETGRSRTIDLSK